VDLGRNLENIRRQKGDWAEGALVASSAERTVKETLLGWIPPGRYLNVVELGIGAEPGAGAFAEVSGADYQGCDRRPSRLQAPPKPGGEVHRLPDGAELSLPTASQDLFLSLFTLERLRMDELYMSIAEMRRVVKPGGYAALAS